jgi:transcriptional regulator with XRE-family HTH domain
MTTDDADANDLARGAEASWPQDWGHLLRLARQVAGLSLTELSATTGLSKGYLSKLESGHPSGRNPSRATLAALARALPSFGPLAHALEPAESAGALALADLATALPEVVRDARGAVAASPVRLGWRELEVLVAVLSLTDAAVPHPANVVVLARAVRRPARETTEVLRRLVRMGVLDEIDAVRPAFPPEYRPSARFAALIGLRRVGDALVLAASLLARAPALQPRPSGNAEQTDEWDGL